MKLTENKKKEDMNVKIYDIERKVILSQVEMIKQTYNLNSSKVSKCPC
ncbi:MAG: hypothetical protein NTZ83_03155 [Candidatus Pacearchaeota archaeon]|nr:hypothetical protein [Candidatus Pacearchaeota archaeon]